MDSSNPKDFWSSKPERIFLNPSSRHLPLNRLGEKICRESTAQLRKAIDLFRRAADSGISDASFQLGRLYQQGLGIPRDPVAAFENFLAAADTPTGHPAAGAWAIPAVG